jgi:endogenous inhibitor of DNA gyrase (YacG/DUF329 family)
VTGPSLPRCPVCATLCPPHSPAPFCSQRCEGDWQQWDQDRQLAAVFGTADAGRYIVGNLTPEPEPEPATTYVPDFETRTVYEGHSFCPFLDKHAGGTTCPSCRYRDLRGWTETVLEAVPS